MEDTKCRSKINCRDEFLAVFPSLVQDLTSQPEIQDMEETNTWLEKVLKYNIPHGKLQSGLTVASSYRSLCKNISPENLRLAYILGWIIEFLERSVEMSGDIMDENEISRGKTCWHRTESVTGAIAYNDDILVETAAFVLLRIHFKNEPFYKDLLNSLHDALQKQYYGNSYDRALAFEFKSRSDSYTPENYELLAKYQTTYLRVYTPIKLGMILAGVNSPEVFRCLEKITLKLGQYLRVQNDFVNCFGKCTSLDSGRSDIRNRKCRWLFLSAIKEMDVQQQQKFKDLYGGSEDNKVEQVVEIYHKLDLQTTYKRYQEETRKLIYSYVQTLPDNLPKDVFINLLD